MYQMIFLQYICQIRIFIFNMPSRDRRKQPCDVILDFMTIANDQAGYLDYLRVTRCLLACFLSVERA